MGRRMLVKEWPKPEYVRASNEERYGVPWRTDAAELLRLIASHLETMAKALDEEDDILGALSGMGLANHLPMLPKHIRDVFIEYLDDEAARASRAETLYWEEMSPCPPS